MGLLVAAQSYLPVILPTEELTAGNARLQTGWSVADIGGPGLAGWLVQAFSAPIAILVDGVSYLVSGALLAGIRVPKATRVPAEGAQPHFWRELLEGVRLVAGNPVLRATAAAAGI
jgi:MFS family permease